MFKKYISIILVFSLISYFLESRSKLVWNPENFATIVRNQIKLHLGDKIPTLTEIASVLGLKNAEFQKQLKMNDLLFPDLLRAARRELALHYMIYKCKSILIIA